MSASIALQEGIHRVLSGSYDVFDMVQPNRRTPYINFGDDNVTDVDTKTHFRTEHSINLHVHSFSTNVREARTIEEYIKQKLLREPFFIENYRIDSRELAFSITERTEQNQDSVKYDVLLNYIFVLSRRK